MAVVLCEALPGAYPELSVAILLRKWCKAIKADSNDRYVYYGMVVLEPRIALQRRRAVGLPDVAGVLVHTVETGA